MKNSLPLTTLCCCAQFKKEKEKEKYLIFISTSNLGPFPRVHEI
jgi:hypothetical protein